MTYTRFLFASKKIYVKAAYVPFHKAKLVQREKKFKIIFRALNLLENAIRIYRDKMFVL